MKRTSIVRSGYTFKKSIGILFRLTMGISMFCFLFGEQFNIDKGYTGFSLLSEGVLFDVKGFLLYGVLFLGGGLAGLLASKSYIKILATGMQAAFFFFTVTTASAFEPKFFGDGFKLCFLLTAVNFIVALVSFISEKNATEEKDLSVSILLTIFFGPIGLFYASRKGAIIMLAVSFILLIIYTGISTVIIRYSLHTGTLFYLFKICAANCFLLVPIPIACTIWGIIAVNKYNQKLLSETLTAP